MKRPTLNSIAGILLVLLTISTANAWTNGQNATYVIGQADFVSSGAATTATTLTNPRDVALDLIHGKLYVADKDNHRVLRFAYPVTGNQPTAELVFGQPDFVTGAAPAGAGRSTFNNPYSIAVDAEGRLWVASGDHRVVWFDNAHLTSGNQPDADGVLGQPNFTTNTPGLTRNTMDDPMGIDIDVNGTLYVSESDNNRVLRFDNAADKADGADADGVLGQPDFDTNTAGIDQVTMSRPLGLRVFGSTLFVGDRSNGRVLRFNNAADKANGAPADGVLGQADFATNTGTITQNRLHAAGKMAIDGSGRLYVADGFTADRVMVFNNVLAKANGADADYVLGQADFTSSGGAIGQNRLNMDSHGGGLALDSATNTLFVCDDNNNRVMVFKTTFPGPEINLKAGVSYLPAGGSIDFGSDTEITFTIENPGDSNLILGGVPAAAISGTDASQFVVMSQPATTVVPTASTSFTVSLRASSLGAKAATLTIASNDSDEPAFTLALTADATTINPFTPTSGGGSGGGGGCFVTTLDSGDKEVWPVALTIIAILIVKACLVYKIKWRKAAALVKERRFRTVSHR